MSTLEVLRGAPTTAPASWAPSGSPRPAPWRDAPAGGSRLGRAAPGPSGLPASRLRLGRTGSMFDTTNVTLFESVSPLAQRRLVPQTREELSVQSRSCGLRGGLSPGLPGPRPWAPCTAPSQAPESHACSHCSGPRPRGPSHHAEHETATGLSLLLHPHGQHPAKASSSPDWVQA